MRFALMLALGLGVSGCGAFDSLSSGASGFSGGSGPFSGGGGIRGSASEVDGIRFRTRLSKDSEDRRSFTTATRGASRNVTAALEAGRVEAVEYCLRNFGGSEIEWSIGPDRPIEEVTPDESGALILAGRCVTR
ncbi:hypothetical protein [Jannaschia pohangensis]|uniref:Lipoprotein n=1 Tax=Jannaschia pohangensis TaxID=390807 RepID=A0A1I3Q509_9RHOB|nr:hypothetical protein [Jannaschia pohangensis]SFJ28497.1 hypothetical protein SAMN04488095_2406 [Jannaschia pohangensis]